MFPIVSLGGVHGYIHVLTTDHVTRMAHFVIEDQENMSFGQRQFTSRYEEDVGLEVTNE